MIYLGLVETAGGKVLWANRKVGASADSSPAQIALSKLPDLVWETELVAEEEVKTASDETAPKAN